MADLLNIGATALHSYRAAMAAVGENVANAQTPGFSRRTVSLAEVGTGLNGARNASASVQFNGVRVDSIQRNWQSRLAGDVWESGGALNAATARHQWLSAVETRLSNDHAQIGTALSGVFDGADRLAANPGDAALRSEWLSSLDNMGLAFRRAGTELGEVHRSIGEALAYSVEQANAAITQLHRINAALKATEAGSAMRASLEDARDVQITTLTGQLGVDMTFGAKGDVYIRHGNATLLDGDGPHPLRLITGDDGSRSIAAINAADLVPITPTSGAIAGHLSATTTLNGQQDQLDALARDTKAYFNGWSTGGVDRSGNPGTAIFSGTDAASLTLTLSSPDGLALSRVGQPSNANLLALSSQRSVWALEQRWSDLSVTAAQHSAHADQAVQASDNRHQSNSAAMNAVTGVDLDTEAAELLRLQLAYNAAARVVRVAQETISEVIRTL